MRQGAFDYLTKPCKLAELEALLNRVPREARADATNSAPCSAASNGPRARRELVGESPAMDRVRQLIAKVAPTNSSVLILGETGTGKELVARALHDQSHRAAEPFVAINCGALPENLIESELFGHRKGSFTGADEHRIGLFEVANGGTLFLDEIGELPKAMQAKLLRVLESGEIRRVGENESLTVDVRVVCATHRQLDEMVDAGEFREDLLFRINTFEIPLPPLRAADRRHRPAGPAFAGPLPAARPARRRSCSRPRRWSCSRRTVGRAMSASWRTSSSMRRSSAKRCRSRSSTCPTGSNVRHARGSRSSSRRRAC